MGTKDKPQKVAFFFAALFLLFGMQIQQKEFVQGQNALEKKVAKQGSLLDQIEKNIQTFTQQNKQLAIVVTEQKKQMIQQEKQIEQLKKDVVKAKAKVLPSRGQIDQKKEFYVEATGYTAYCNGCSGKTKWHELDLRAHPEYKIVAVDPRIIPLGTKVYVDGYGYAVTGDTGGAIKGYKVDLFFPKKQQALNWGRRTVKITVY